MRQLRALDLFCGAGGASMGLYRAGFEVTGVDIKPQPRYPFEFHQANAMDFPFWGYDFIWASPPCQAFTAMKTMHNAKKHIDLLTPTRSRLGTWGRPYAIENVPGAPLLAGAIRLCGSAFGLGAGGGELRRHRYFETSFPLLAPQCAHGNPTVGVYGGHVRDRRRTIGVYGCGARDSRRKADKGIDEFTVAHAREAMGIDWMTLDELCQAIPPAYSEFIGKAALRIIAAEALRCEGQETINTEG